MPQAAAAAMSDRNPPVDYAVAVWLGTPKHEIEQGLRDGSIRRPGFDVGAMSHQTAGFGPASPPAPEGGTTGSPGADSTLPDDVRARIEALLRRLDPALQSQTFDDAWNEAGSDDGMRARCVADFLGRALNVRQDGASGLAQRLASLERAAEGVDAHGRFVRFDGMTGRELEQLAMNDGSVRRALAEHSPWAFAGSRELTRLGDASGRYDRFDPDTGELLLTDAWLGDRARHAAWRSAGSGGRPLEVEGDGWRFVDRAAGDAAAVELRGLADRPVHQVIFARDDGDRVTGSAATDRIHGGDGDDMLRGRGGDDLLEGGAGSDALQGGSGRDLIAGQQGDDELDGGAGDDRLDGGSGNDELVGGRGDDRLRGGSGVDSYRFEAGDGSDTIEDDSGVVIIDDVAIAGTMRRRGDGWVSADGRFEFSLEDGGSDGHTLLIRGAEVDGEGASQTAVRIASWTAGAFGLSLADSDEHDEDSGVEREPAAGQDAAEAPTDAFPPLPPQQGDSGGDEGDDAGTDSGTDAPLASLLPPDDASGQSTGGFEALPVVDLQMVSRALDAWSPPAPPDIDGVANGPIGITLADIGDALSESGGEVDTDGGAGPVTLEQWSPPWPARAADLGPRSPPDSILPRLP